MGSIQPWSILLLKQSLFQRIILAKNVVCASHQQAVRSINQLLS
jgi:hypothetical protein